VALTWGIQGCKTVPEQAIVKKDGKAYGVTQGAFRHRWWNYYERALSFADGEFWKEAESDLREAIRQREDDQRRARTYGFHFTDYFPHRELGVVFFNQRRFEEAVQELTTSLSKSMDIASALSSKLTSRLRGDPILATGISLRGYIFDNSGIAEWRVNGRKFPHDGSPDLKIEQKTILQLGEKTLVVEAEDRAGNVTSSKIALGMKPPEEAKNPGERQDASRYSDAKHGNRSDNVS